MDKLEHETQKFADFNENELERLKVASQAIIEYAKRSGASDVEVGSSLSQGLDVNVRLGELETLAFNRDKSISVSVYFGKNKGSASTTDLSQDAIYSMVDKACQIAKHTSIDNDSGLPDKNQLAIQFEDLSLHHPWDIEPSDAITQAVTCENLARSGSADITNSEGAALSTVQSAYVYGNSKGFLQGYLTSRHAMNCVLIAEKNGKKERGYWYTTARHPDSLDSLKKIAQLSVERTVARLDAHKIKTQQCPIIFSADIASSLVGHFLNAIEGSTLYRKASFLSDSLNKQVLSSNLQLKEDPFIKQGWASRCFDNEGVATKERIIVENGCLNNYLLDTYSAKKLNMSTTGNCGGAHNILVNATSTNTYSFTDLLKKMDTGLLVTGLMGHGVNLVTGDYSRGAIGFWVEHGEIQYPVEEITIAGNLKDMLKNIVALGNDVDTRSSILTGSLLLDNMTVAGN